MIIYPTEIRPLDAKLEINTSKELGLTAGVFVKEVARKLPKYGEFIECSARGTDKEGKTIGVNTLGRWLFGLPGYQGNIRIVPEGSAVALYYPKESPGPVHELLTELKSEIEKGDQNE